ncbi:MAG: hypothetical protein K0U52_13535 [Gammaproteobacteria bacterium]|nr:hypothetical protein [Gammaproteobacteria bacterium]
MATSRLAKCLQKARLTSDTDISEATHYSLAGGKYHISQKHNDWFLGCLAYELWQNQRFFYLIELKTPVFRMHMDLDFIQTGTVEEGDVKRLVQMLSTIIHSFYSHLDANDPTLTAILMTTSPKKAKTPDKPNGEPLTEDEEAIQCYKTGYHVLWPNLLVNKEQALTMRYACLLEVQDRLPERRWPFNPYEDVIDESVLQANGLRMMGCDKCKRCKDCEDIPDYCQLCNGSKIIPENRRYFPTLAIQEDGSSDEELMQRLTGTTLQDFLTKVKCCSIRVVDPSVPVTPGFERPGLTPECPNLEKKKRKRKIPLQTPQDRKFKDTDDIDQSTRTFQHIQAFINEHMGPPYAELQLKRLRHAPEKRLYFCQVTGSGMHHCGNVGRDHGSSTIYFQIDEHNGMFQRCFSHKNNCRRYNGPAVALTTVLQTALFTMAMSAKEHYEQAVRSMSSDPRTLKERKMDALVQVVGEHVERKREELEKLQHAEDAVHAKKKRAVALNKIANVPVAKTAPKKMSYADLTWREADALRGAEFLRVSKKINDAHRESAKQMHDEVFGKEETKKKAKRAGDKNAKGKKGKKKKQKTKGMTMNLLDML